MAKNAKKPKGSFAAFALLRTFAVCSFLGCSPASVDGLAPSVDHGGPKIVFDLLRTPLPEIPFPNDLATRPDSSSPTGLRINASLVAPSQLERNVRGLLDTLDGFGTFAPMSVAFDQDLDVLDLYARQNNADPNDDGAYLVDLSDGSTVPLDFNGGHFPYTLVNPSQYFLDDPNTGLYNLLFPPDNWLHPELPHDTVRAQADDLLTFYERDTRTLILRPVVPMKQEHRYAVVLTNRIRGTNGNAISSPHAGINHASQTVELKPLLSHLPPGTQLSDIAYAWAFTTQSTTRDLEQIRLGLVNGRGPLQNMQFQYRVQAGSTTAHSSLINVLQERGAYTAGTPSASQSDYVLPVQCAAGSTACLSSLLGDPQIQQLLIGTDPAEVQALTDTFKYVDYFVSAQFNSPSFLNTPSGAPQDQTFQIDYASGNARTQDETITLTLSVPKARPEAGHVPPFPVAIVGHGYKSMRLEAILGFSGTFAKFGVASVAIDAYGHGIGIDPLTEVLARNVAKTYGLDAFADAIFSGRARDLDYDGVKDSGGDFWTADTFHTRDVVRQSVVDWMQLSRLLRSFDGTGTMHLGTGFAKAGDFNADGVPDIAGPATWPNDVFTADGKTKLFNKGAANPGSDQFVFGISLGGILSAVLPAVEPSIVAAAPVSAGGGLADVGIRSVLHDVVQAVFLELFGPFFATCHFDAGAGDADPQTGIKYGACVDGAPDTLVLVVQDVNHERDIPIAPLTLANGQAVMVKNLAQNPAGTGCAPDPKGVIPKIDGCAYGVADASGRLRLPLSADWPSLSATRTDQGPGLPQKVAVTVLSPGDALEVDVIGGPTITKYQLPSRFFGVSYKAGDPLTSPARGYGLSRNTPDFRRLMQLSQLILEPGDPVNYAPYYFSSQLAARAQPANVVVVATSGDPGVPVNTGIALARAAGVVDAASDRLLIQGGAVEAVPQTRRFDDPDGGVYAALPGQVVCNPGDDCTGDVLIDPTCYSLDGGICNDGLQAPRLNPPLQQQLVRQSEAPTTLSYSAGASLCPAGEPGVSALMIPYLNRTGEHGFRNPQPGKVFDMDQFMANVIGRFFECRGRELHFEGCQQDLASCPWIPPPPP